MILTTKLKRKVPDLSEAKENHNVFLKNKAKKLMPSQQKLMKNQELMT